MPLLPREGKFFDFFNQHAELAVLAAVELQGAARRSVATRVARSRRSSRTKSRPTRSRTRPCSCCIGRSSRRSTATKSTSSSPAWTTSST